MAKCETQTTTACRGCALRKDCAIVEDDRYTRRQRWKAMFLAYILPFILLVGGIMVADWLTDNEYIVGGVALGGVALYFLILFFQKPKI